MPIINVLGVLHVDVIARIIIARSITSEDCGLPFL